MANYFSCPGNVVTIRGAGISAKRASFTDDFLENEPDLNTEFIRDSSSIFYAKVKGDSMRDAGINNGDILVVDRSVRSCIGKIAICYVLCLFFYQILNKVLYFCYIC